MTEVDGEDDRRDDRRVARIRKIEETPRQNSPGLYHHRDLDIADPGKEPGPVDDPRCSEFCENDNVFEGK